MTRKLVFASIIALFSVLPFEGLSVGAATLKQQPVIAGPVFISLVFPVVELKQERLEMFETITDAYSFWGRMMISSLSEKAYFPAPLSYPYRYSKSGIQALQRELRKRPEIDSTSIQLKSFDNIPQERQSSYTPSELKQILLHETYISFRIKKWTNIELMAFPTFVVITFDYTQSGATASRDYEAVKRRLSPLMSEFQQMEGLQSVLGISRKGKPWANVPILGFTAINQYEMNTIWRIYYSGDISAEEARRLFLQNVSIRDFPKGIDATDPIVTHCQDISHEMSGISLWRFYYAGHPIFYDRQFGEVIDHSYLHGSRSRQTRILRTALFINVTLPSLLDLSQSVQRELAENLLTLTRMRAELFNEFSDKINELNNPIMRSMTSVESKVEPTIHRLEEAITGYERLVRDMEQPFLPPIQRRRMTSASDDSDECLRLFSFDERRTFFVSDRVKATAYADEMKRYLVAIQREKDRLRNELSGALSLLESRRNLVWARDNTKRSILAAEENSKAAIETAQGNTRLAIIFAAVNALVFFILGRLSNTTFFERRRQKKMRESNRKRGEEM